MRQRRPDGTFRPRNGDGASTVDLYEQMTFRKALPALSPRPANDDPLDAMPPNLGREAVKPVWTFQSILSSVSGVFRNPDEAWKDSRLNARVMRNDCSIMECLEARQRAVELLNWHIEPEDSKDAKQTLAAETMTRLIKKIRHFKKYRHWLSEAIWFGRVANSQVWKWCFEEGQRYAYVADWSPINGDKLVFRFDDGSGKFDPDQIGIRVGSQNKIDHRDQLEPTDWGMAYFLKPWERACLAVDKHIIEDAAFEDPLSAGSIHGVGIRSRIYWTWYQMQETLALLVEFMEKTGLGIWIYFYPAGNAEAKAQTEELARDQHSRDHLVFPKMPGDLLDSYSVERIDPNPAGAEMLKTIIVDLFYHRIKRYILGQTLSTESEGAGLGSSGISDLHKWGFFQIIKSDAIDREETLTEELVKPLLKFNPQFREVSNRAFRFKLDTESPDVGAQLEALERAWSMGLRIKASDVYDLIGMSEPTSEDEILSNAQQGMAGAAGDPFGQNGMSGQIGNQRLGGAPTVREAITSAVGEVGVPENMATDSETAAA